MASKTFHRPQRSCSCCHPDSLQFLIENLGSFGRNGLDHRLQSLQRHDLDHIRGGLGLDDHLLLRERADPLAFRSGRLANHFDLQKIGDGKNARTTFAQVLPISVASSSSNPLTCCLLRSVASHRAAMISVSSWTCCMQLRIFLS